MASVLNATSITLFSGTTEVGSLSYDGLPDPTFTGGFVGIKSTVPFNTVAIHVNAAAGLVAKQVQVFLTRTLRPSS